MLFAIVVACGLAAVAALPTPDPVIMKLEPGPRYQHVADAEGEVHLVDMWLKASDLAESARFIPDEHNVYHLFTRRNPTVSQPLLMSENGLLGSTYYNAARRTIVLLHGWRSSVTSDINTVLVPAFLAAEDVNVIVCDWNRGSGTINYAAAVTNTIQSGLGVARFLNWLNSATGATATHYHIVGHSLGGHKAGIASRNMNGNVAYVTALDPASPGWNSNSQRFQANDGVYTEVIHTNAGLLGYMPTLGQVDFYPNGGVNMPGCSSQECSHARCYHYLAESITSGGFTGRRCATYAGAVSGNCVLFGNLRMGGLVPKTGSSGIYYLETNASPPFSRG